MIQVTENKYPKTTVNLNFSNNHIITTMQDHYEIITTTTTTHQQRCQSYTTVTRGTK